MKIGTATVLAVNGLPPAPRRTRKDRSPITEKQFMAQVVEFAKLNGWLVYHTYDSRRSESGFPDLVMVKGRRIVFAELKRAGAYLTAHQTKWLDKLRLTGAEVCLWYPGSWRIIESTLV